MTVAVSHALAFAATLAIAAAFSGELPRLRPGKKLLAYSVGATAAAAAVAAATWTGTGPTSGPRQAKQPSDMSSQDTVLCVAADGALKVPGPKGCGSEGRVVVDHVDTRFLDCDDCTAWDQPQPHNQPPRDPVDALDERVNRLHRSPLFTVVDQYDDPIFAVGPDHTRIYRSNQLVARIDAADDGGAYTAISRDGALSTSFGIAASHAGLAVSESGTPRAEIGRQGAGNYALKVGPIREGAMAGIGQSLEGTGAVIVGDSLGQTRASLAFDNDRASMNIFSVSGANIASMRQAESGAGMLVLSNSSGEDAVKMVVNGGRYGVVIAGPRSGFPLISGSGLPGSYIIGCGGGAGCIP